MRFDLFFKLSLHDLNLVKSQSSNIIHLRAKKKKKKNLRMLQVARSGTARSLTIFMLFVAGFRGGRRAMRVDFWVWAKTPNSPLYSCPVWSGAPVQPWGAALMSCLSVCSRLCCCLRSAPASNGCKYSQEFPPSRSLGAPIAPRYVQTMSEEMMSRGCTISRGSLLLVPVFYGVEGPVGSFEMGPQHSSSCSWSDERGCVFCTCASDEGDSRLAGSSSGYERKPLCFINFNAASVKCISAPRSNACPPPQRRYIIITRRRE